MFKKITYLSQSLIRQHREVCFLLTTERHINEESCILPLHLFSIIQTVLFQLCFNICHEPGWREKLLEQQRTEEREEVVVLHLPPFSLMHTHTPTSFGARSCTIKQVAAPSHLVQLQYLLIQWWWWQQQQHSLVPRVANFLFGGGEMRDYKRMYIYSCGIFLNRNKTT